MTLPREPGTELTPGAAVAPGAAASPGAAPPAAGEAVRAQEGLERLKGRLGEVLESVRKGDGRARKEGGAANSRCFRGAWV